MNILFVTTEVPSPKGGGGLIANYYHLRGLVAEGHRVVLVCLVTEDAADAVPEIDGLERIVLIPGVPPTTAVRLLANLLQKEPAPIRKYMGVKARSTLRALFAEYSFDLVHLASLHTAFLVRDLRDLTDAPVVLYQHNVQSRVHELFFRMQSHPLRRWYARLQWRKMAGYEADACRRFERVLTFSQNDADTISGLSQGSTVSWLPLAVDAQRLLSVSQPESFDLLWIGTLRWPPNVDSLRWFMDDLVPGILAARPETSIAVAGSSPPDWLTGVADGRPGIRVLGEVDDAHDLMARSRVVVVPLRIGSGVRVKILEALALRRAVLCTSLGCEGIEVRAGEHLVVADAPDKFAGEAIRLLGDADLRRNLGARGQELVVNRHDYRKVGREMSALYEALLMGERANG